MTPVFSRVISMVVTLAHEQMRGSGVRIVFAHQPSSPNQMVLGSIPTRPTIYPHPQTSSTIRHDIKSREKSL
jgi:hypothetical protein